MIHETATQIMKSRTYTFNFNPKAGIKNLSFWSQTGSTQKESHKITLWLKRKKKKRKLKIKLWMLKAAKEKQEATYRGTSIKLSLDFSRQNLQLEGSSMIHSKW